MFDQSALCRQLAGLAHLRSPVSNRCTPERELCSCRAPRPVCRTLYNEIPAGESHRWCCWDQRTDADPTFPLRSTPGFRNLRVPDRRRRDGRVVAASR